MDGWKEWMDGYGETCILVNVSKELRFSMETVVCLCG